MARNRLICWREAIRDSDSLSANAKLIAYTISGYMHVDGAGAYPSLDTIAARAPKSRKRVIAAINELEAAGYLRVERGGGRRHPNRYLACFPQAEESNDEPWRSGGHTVDEWEWNGVEQAA
jgi:hypothetical protein